MKYCAILYKELEHLQILISSGVLKPIPPQILVGRIISGASFHRFFSTGAQLQILGDIYEI